MSTQHSNRRAPERTRLAVEALEERTLLSASSASPLTWAAPGHAPSHITLTVSDGRIEIIDNGHLVAGQDAAVTSAITISTTAGVANTVAIVATPADVPTTVNLQGHDAVLVGGTRVAGGTLANLFGDITINGIAARNDTVALADRADTASHAGVTITDSSVTGLAPATIGYSGISTLNIDGSRVPSSAYTVAGAIGRTYLSVNGAGDTVTVSATSGWISVQGKAAGASATLYGPQTGANNLVARPGLATLTAPDYRTVAAGFAHVDVYSDFAGSVATLTGQGDSFYATPSMATLSAPPTAPSPAEVVTFNFTRVNMAVRPQTYAVTSDGTLLMQGLNRAVLARAINQAAGAGLGNVQAHWTTLDTGITAVAIGRLINPNYVWAIDSAGVNVVNAKPTNAAVNIAATLDGMTDPNVQTALLQGLVSDGALDRAAMLGVFGAIEAEGTVPQTALDDLQSMLQNAGPLGMPELVQDLTNSLLTARQADTTFQSLDSSGAVTQQPLGEPAAGASATHLGELVDKWFFGVDEPATTLGTYSAVQGKLFGGLPKYSDVQQGDVNDGWLLGTAAELAARDPSAIQSLFTYQGTNTVNGATVDVYAVRFFSNGVPRYVTVDTELPGGGTIYTQASSKPLWPALLEKAYAVAAAAGWVPAVQTAGDSYDALASRPPSDAMAALVNQSATAQNADFAAAVSAFRSGQLVNLVASAKPQSDGIVPGQTYTVVGYNAATRSLLVYNPSGAKLAETTNGQFGARPFAVSASFFAANFLNNLWITKAGLLHHPLYDPIQVKYQQMGGSNSYLGTSTTGEMPTGVENGLYQLYQGGAIFWSSITGAHAVSLATALDWLGSATKYTVVGTKVQKVLGLPTTDEGLIPGTGVTVFQGGHIWDAPAVQYGHAAFTYGDVDTEYLATGSRVDGSGNNVQLTDLGVPTADEVGILTISGARVSYCGGGAVFWSSSTGAHAVWGAIYQKYSDVNFQNYGLPISTEENVLYVPGARVVYFQGGREIEWSAATGAHLVYGVIGGEYFDVTRAYLSGADPARRPVITILGAATSDEMDLPGVPGGRTNTFQGGVIYFAPTVGAYPLYGEYLSVYQDSGGPTGFLGLPTSEENAEPGNPSDDIIYFQHGAIAVPQGGGPATVYHF